MFNLENKYDVVETNRISGRYDGTLNRVEFVAGTDIENGRFVNVKDGVANYTTSAEGTFYLVTTPERLYQGGIDEFINEKGNELRCLQLVKGDEISTTAVIDKDLKKGDKVTIGAEGKLTKGEDGIFEVTGFRILGKEKGVTVELL